MAEGGPGFDQPVFIRGDCERPAETAARRYLEVLSKPDYCFSKDGSGVKAEEVYFLEPKTFENHHGGFILANGFIYSGAKHNKGFPICVEMKTGEVKWGGDIRGAGDGSAAVTMADGQIIFRYQNGKLALVNATPSGYELHGSFTPVVQERESWAHPVVSNGMLYLREQNKLMCYDLHE